MSFLGEILALTAALCWAFGSLLFSFAGRRVGAFTVNAVRIPIAAMVLVLISLIAQGMIWPARATSTQFSWLVFSSLVGLVIGDLCYFKSLVILGPQIASLLSASSPIFSVFISWVVLNQSLRWYSLLGIVITLAGLTWVSLERNVKTFGAQENGSKPWGYFLAGIGAVSQTVGLVAAKLGMLDNVTALSAATVRMLAAAVMTWIIAGLQRRVAGVLRGIADRRALTAMFVAAFVGPVAGIWLSLASIQYTKVGIAATLMSTTPLFVIPLVMLIHHERPSARAVIGTVITIAGVAVLMLT